MQRCIKRFLVTHSLRGIGGMPELGTLILKANRELLSTSFQTGEIGPSFLLSLSGIEQGLTLRRLKTDLPVASWVNLPRLFPVLPSRASLPPLTKPDFGIAALPAGSTSAGPVAVAESKTFQLRKAVLMYQPYSRLSALGPACTLLLAISALASCAAPNTGQVPATTSAATSETTSPAGSPTSTADASELCGPGSAINFDRAAFPDSPKIDNKWFPLKPGTVITTTGEVVDAEGTTEHRVTHSVTGLTKVIDGVKTQVLWDRDYADGELVESELAFFAQDNAGTVWLFGEYPEEFENDKFIGAPSTFIHGISGGQAGIAMQAEPRVDTPEYVQAHAPSVDFLDCGEVFKENERVCVPTGCPA